jgi:adenosylcobinamide-phosphate synthase
LVAALLLEQARALSPANPVYLQFQHFADYIRRSFDAGGYRQGVVAWLLAALPLVLIVAALSLWLHRSVPLLALLFDVSVLYLTMVVRQFRHSYSAIQEALRAGDLAQARAVLAGWRDGTAEDLSASEVARLAIERGLYSAHRHVFGVIAWFVVFGAAGAVFYRLAALLCSRWSSRQEGDIDKFGRFSREVFAVAEWVPVRLTALAFAVTGDFEDALYCWRTQAAAWSDRAEGIVLAAAGGAIGVRLGSVVGSSAALELRPELGTGEEADSELMTAAVGLIWRALVLWLFVIALLTLAGWFGSTAG